jgi:hypothetical protein
MSAPSFILGLVIASLLGSAFHLWRGGSLGRLVLYLVLAWIGFGVGQIVASQLGWTFWSVGPLHLGLSIPGCLVFLGLGYWLSLVRGDDSRGKSRKRGDLF